MTLAEPNLECAKGHRSYAPNPDHFVTTERNRRFCVQGQCRRHNVPVRKIGGEWQYGMRYCIAPPEEVEEECSVA